MTWNLLYWKTDFLNFKLMAKILKFNLMEVEVIKDSIPALYSDSKPEPAVIVFLAKVWVFIGFRTLKPDYLD